jgi:hypothetical protein
MSQPRKAVCRTGLVLLSASRTRSKNTLADSEAETPVRGSASRTSRLLDGIAASVK